MRQAGEPVLVWGTGTCLIRSARRWACPAMKWGNSGNPSLVLVVANSVVKSRFGQREAESLGQLVGQLCLILVRVDSGFECQLGKGVEEGKIIAAFL